jgi:SAM-dependent methyltransferase
MIDFDKEFFQRTWGESGYYEMFSYGVGIHAVCKASIDPFIDKSKVALEIGCGGGVFTEYLLGRFKHLFGIDVIKKPELFALFKDFTYIEQSDRATSCEGIETDSIDFCFSYNVFCHLSNEMLTEYLKSVYRVLKHGGDFVFMMANWKHSKKNVPNPENYKIGDMLPFGHFYQTDDTLDIIADIDQWKVVKPNMLPEHRDIIVHLRKK